MHSFAQDWEVDKIMPLIAQSGVGWIRDELYWNNFEKVKGTYQVESTAAQIAQLLHELKMDSELVGLVQLVKDISAVLTLSRALASPDRNAPSGLSDITNRGPIHRLLTSELAHDDDILAMRLALNEALYLKNEPPAVTPLSELVILVDSGIRLWGIPRIFATACALALLSKASKRQATRTFRAQMADAVGIELTHKAGLLQHLSALELNEHPAAAVQYLTQGMDEGQSVDLVVVTHEQALMDPALACHVNCPPTFTFIWLESIARAM